METISEQKRYCPRCSSLDIVKSGTHMHQRGRTQRYRCKQCGTSFITEGGYYRGRHPLSLLQYAGVLYQQGLSAHKIRERLERELGVKVSHVSIAEWVKKLGIQPRKTSGDQKHKAFRDLVEVGVVTTVRYADSFRPERFMVLGNLVEAICDKSEERGT